MFKPILSVLLFVLLSVACTSDSEKLERLTAKEPQKMKYCKANVSNSILNKNYPKDILRCIKKVTPNDLSDIYKNPDKYISKDERMMASMMRLEKEYKEKEKQDKRAREKLQLLIARIMANPFEEKPNIEKIMFCRTPSYMLEHGYLVSKELQSLKKWKERVDDSKVLSCFENTKKENVDLFFGSDSPIYDFSSARINAVALSHLYR